MKRNISAEKIDAILPQTQCGLCHYGGCMPYAKAIANENAAINLCPPGGIEALIKIAELVAEDPKPYIPDMQKNAKSLLRAVIREDECIGCTKCIQACPVDAILGAAKQMHTVISDECTGCELCIAPCPVDCIDMIVLSNNELRSDHHRKRYLAREKRMQKKNQTDVSVEKNTLKENK